VGYFVWLEVIPGNREEVGAAVSDQMQKLLVRSGDAECELTEC
jgi:hypothetical protein